MGAELVFRKYKELNKRLIDYEDSVFQGWVGLVEGKTLEGLAKPLLLRDPTKNTLVVNFGADLVAILSEVGQAALLLLLYTALLLFR